MRKIQVIAVLALAAAISTAAISAETISSGTRKDLILTSEAFLQQAFDLQGDFGFFGYLS